MMTREAIVLYTLIGYNLLLISIGLWAARRNSDAHDFLLAGGKLGGWVAGLSASASSSSAWTLLGVSGAAFAWGLPALWLFPATLGGFAINWFFVAPRLYRLTQDTGSLTLSGILAPREFEYHRLFVLRAASAIILFCFLFYIAAQFDGAGKAFGANFGWSPAVSILIGAAIVMLYTLIGGFWAVSVTDALQAAMMLLVALILPLATFVAASSDSGAWLAVTSTVGAPDMTGWVGVAFVLGTLGIGLGYPGQPHVVNRFMALKDEAALRRGRLIAMSWAVIVYSGMLALGLSARVLFAETADGEQALFLAASSVLPPILGGLVLAAVLSAIMSTADSQLLTAAAAISHDWRGDKANAADAPGKARIVVVVLSVLAVLLALYVPDDIFSRVLFAWHAIGSAFGPLLVARLLGRRIGPMPTLFAMLLGFGLTVLLHWFPDAPGDWMERLLPLVASAGVVVMAGKRGEVV